MDKELKALLEAILAKVDKINSDFTEFSERFDEVVTQLEDERRLDLMRDSYGS